MNDACVEIDGLGLELGYLAVRHAGPNAGEEAEREIGHPDSAFMSLGEFHHRLDLGESEGLRETAFPTNAEVRHFRNRILCDPAALEAVFEERREQAAPVVVRLHPAFAGFQKRNQFRGGDFRDGLFREEIGEPLHLPANPIHLRHGELILRELAFLGGDVFGRSYDQRLLLFWLLVIAQREIDVERERSR